MIKKLNHLYLLLVFIAISSVALSCNKDKDTPPRPAIESISPESVVPGDIVTITGTGFGTSPANVRVQFNTVYATNIVSITDTEIKAEAPSGFEDEEVNVRVFVSEAASPTAVIYYADLSIPFIDETTPTFFYTSRVKISGINFSPNPTDNVVKFGEIEGEVVEATNTSLTVITPDLGSATTTTITVTKFGQESNSKTATIEPDQDKIARHQWTTHTAKPGVVYKTSTFSVFGSAQRRIHILDVTLDETNTLGIGATANNSSSFKSTVAICEDYDAVAGINAGYFDLGGTYKDPYIRIDGNTIQLGNAEPISTHFTNAALLIKDNVATVRRLGTNGNTLNQVAAAIPVEEAEHVIVSGPMVITDDEVGVVNPTNGHNTSVTSRTGLGVSADGKRVWMVVVDTGNGSTGVSTPELGRILQALGAVDAMNFDGGGSSTMFVKDHGNSGLVNTPSGSLRRVHSVIYVK